MAAQWPVVHAALMQLLPTLPGWSGVVVFDGPQVTGEAPRLYVTVGYAALEESAGSFAHERAGNGFMVYETGSVRCELVAYTGDADFASVRAAAFARLDALEEAIRADQTLGVLAPSSTTALSVDVLPSQTSVGAAQRLAFSVEYVALS